MSRHEDRPKSADPLLESSQRQEREEKKKDGSVRERGVVP